MLKYLGVIVVLALGIALASCASTPVVTNQTVIVAGVGPVEVEQMNVDIVDVEPSERIVRVRQGRNTWQVAVPEVFGNLQNIHAGDRVEIRRVEGAVLGARRARKGAEPSIIYSEAATDPLFQNVPEKWVVRSLTLTARFEKFDPTTRVVSYVGPAGPRTVSVVDPAIQSDLRRLRRGDMVELTFAEAFFIQKL